MINKDITTAAELIKKWESFKSNAYLCQLIKILLLLLN